MPVPALSAADDELVQRYLQHVAVEKRLAARTLALYTIDLHKLAVAATTARVALTAVQTHHVRRWVAQMHAGGRSG
ncbi:MAG: site-specific integrase, partial [Burkholderiales bacterium]|nr:site-specific integrase [Burkholderiales bacterium]